MGQGGDGGIDFAEARLNLCQCDLGIGLVHRIVLVVFDRALRLLERSVSFKKFEIGKIHQDRQCEDVQNAPNSRSDARIAIACRD